MSNLTGILSAAIAAAEGLADAPDGTVDAELALVRLVTVGDVLRAFKGYSATMAIHPVLRSWLRSCEQPLLAEAVRLHSETIGTLSTHRNDESLPFSLLMRDQTRSIMAALYWRCFIVSHSSDLLAAMAKLDAASDRFDAALTENGVTAAEIAVMLGDRAEMPNK